MLFIISESRAMIIGSEDLYIHEGSPVSLQCRVEDSAGPPAYIYWYKGGEVINYSNQKHIEISYSSLDTNPVSTLVIKVSQTVSSARLTEASLHGRRRPRETPGTTPAPRQTTDNTAFFSTSSKVGQHKGSLAFLCKYLMGITSIYPYKSRMNSIY